MGQLPQPSGKYSMISTPIQRARAVSTKPELLNSQLQHIRKALTKCKYPTWALVKVERKFINRSQEKSNAVTSRENQVKKTVTTPLVTIQGGTLPRINTTMGT